MGARKTVRCIIFISSLCSWPWLFLLFLSTLRPRKGDCGQGSDGLWAFKKVQVGVEHRGLWSLEAGPSPSFCPCGLVFSAPLSSGVQTAGWGKTLFQCAKTGWLWLAWFPWLPSQLTVGFSDFNQWQFPHVQPSIFRRPWMSVAQHRAHVQLKNNIFCSLPLTDHW